MENNDNQRLAIRPVIPFEEAALTDVHIFQQKTLRPVLKMQHAIIFGVFDAHVSSVQPQFHDWHTPRKHACIAQMLKNDRPLQLLLRGCIIGMFTQQEIAFWLQHKQEVNRRITQLLITRIQSHY